ncbi:FkbM family methyltransferase [Sphingobacterium suaedae]|uniref:FkbM family methyltransferase n=1 Tax=Sphingobacterium suaedae TaxID=1686402 RepID=A0ABW5KLM0_9SPHI
MERNNRLKRLEYWIKARMGRIAFIDVQYKIPKVWYGSDYGGFYVHPTPLDHNAIVYSFGIGEDISFDTAMIAEHGCQVFGFDPTPKSIDWLKTQRTPENFHFYSYGLGEKTEEVTFFLPKNKTHVSGSIFGHQLVNDDDYISVPLKSFPDIIKETGHTKIDVLKMDIEGSEYVVIDSILKSGIPIGQLLLETHERFFADGKEKGEIFFEKLYKQGYRIFGISDTYQEISLIKV